ncbi:hypothetical protein ACRTDU_04460 [Sunxiuqinia elliptica]
MKATGTQMFLNLNMSTAYDPYFELYFKERNTQQVIKTKTIWFSSIFPQFSIGGEGQSVLLSAQYSLIPELAELPAEKDLQLEIGLSNICNSNASVRITDSCYITDAQNHKYNLTGWDRLGTWRYTYTTPCIYNNETYLPYTIYSRTDPDGIRAALITGLTRNPTIDTGSIFYDNEEYYPSEFANNFKTYINEQGQLITRELPMMWTLWRSPQNKPDDLTRSKFQAVLSFTEVEPTVATFDFRLDFLIGTTNSKKNNEMILTQEKFKNIAENTLSFTDSNKIFYKNELINFSHNDTENAKVIRLTNSEQELCFIDHMSIYIQEQGTTFSSKILYQEQAVQTLLKVVPEGIEGTDEAGGYFADTIEIKGNVSGQIIVMKAYVK